MKYEVQIGVPGNTFRRNIVVEAPDELTAAYRAGHPADRRDIITLEVIAIRSEEETHFSALGPEIPDINDPEDV